MGLCIGAGLRLLGSPFLERQLEIYRFVRGMIGFRRAHEVLSEKQFYTDAQIRWLAPSGGHPDWFDSTAKTHGCLIREGAKDALLLIFNADTKDIDFDMPALPLGSHWHLAVDTSHLTAPDVLAAGAAPLADQLRSYRLPGRSSAIFVVREQESTSGPVRV